MWARGSRHSLVAPTRGRGAKGGDFSHTWVSLQQQQLCGPSVRPGGAPVGSGYRDPPVAVVERMKSVSVAGCCLAVGLINFNSKGKSVR